LVNRYNPFSDEYHRARLLAGIGAVEAGAPARNPFERFMDRGLDIARTISDPFISKDPDDFRFLPLAHPDDVPDKFGLKEFLSSPFTPFAPPGFAEAFPEPLQPTGRVLRSLTSPGSIALLPFGGVGRSAYSVAGSAAGAQGLAPFGETAEGIGAMLGGFAQPGALARGAPRKLGVLPEP